jgi:hypothetical protein
VFTVKDACESIIADPKWAETMVEYGITNEAIEENMAKGTVLLEDWIIQNGYNLTEIKELIWPANGTETGYDDVVSTLVARAHTHTLTT